MLVTKSAAISIIQQVCYKVGEPDPKSILGVDVIDGSTRTGKWSAISYQVEGAHFSGYDRKNKHSDGRIRDASRDFEGDRLMFAAWAIAASEQCALDIPDEWHEAITSPQALLAAECRVDLSFLRIREARQMVDQILGVTPDAHVELVNKVRRPNAVYCNAQGGAIAKMFGADVQRLKTMLPA